MLVLALSNGHRRFLLCSHTLSYEAPTSTGKWLFCSEFPRMCLVDEVLEACNVPQLNIGTCGLAVDAVQLN